MLREKTARGASGPCSDRLLFQAICHSVALGVWQQRPSTTPLRALRNQCEEEVVSGKRFACHCGVVVAFGFVLR